MSKERWVVYCLLLITVLTTKKIEELLSRIFHSNKVLNKKAPYLGGLIMLKGFNSDECVYGVINVTVGFGSGISTEPMVTFDIPQSFNVPSR